MNYYYDMPQDQRERTGIDHDLFTCLKENPQPFTIDDIAKVLAVHEGANDGDDWRWVLSLNDGRFVFLQGWCDYTGWDCQSDASSAFADTPEGAAKEALNHENSQPVYESLVAQLESTKTETWREKTDKELGL